MGKYIFFLGFACFVLASLIDTIVGHEPIGMMANRTHLYLSSIGMMITGIGLKIFLEKEK